MILHFSKTLILILLLIFIIFYKYLFGKRILINAILDFFVGIVILFVSTSYLESKIPNSDGHGSVIIYLFNFIFFSILYIISNVVLHWKRSILFSALIPIGIYSLYIVYVFFFFEFAQAYDKCVLYSVFLSFFPIYIYNYFQILNEKIID